MNTWHPIAFGVSLLGSSLAAQAGGTLAITPAALTVAPGDSFAVQVRGIDFTDQVVGGGFNLSFDPGVLSLLSVSVDTATWEFVSSSGQIDNAAGTLTDVYFNSFRPQLPTGSFSVATLEFRALTPGSSSSLLSGSPTFPFADDLGEVISVTFQGADLTVSAVPEPGSAALWAMGLLAAWGLKRAPVRKSGEMREPLL